MESMINRIYTMSDADTKLLCAATSVGAKDTFLYVKTQLWYNKAVTASAALLCFLFTAKTHAQTLDWVNSVGGEGFDAVNTIAVDNEGNVYTTGSFNDTVDFDPGTGVYILSAIGESDIFIQKLDANGNFLWAKSFGGKGSDESNSISVDAAGNICITGVFSDTVDFDFGKYKVKLTDVGDSDIFILKMK